MVERQADGDIVRVTFRLTRTDGGQTASVVGDFNAWSSSAHPMQRDESSFVCRIPLEPGRSYRFRYLVDGHRWENDWDADAYVPNEFGGDDSVVDLTVLKPTARDAPATRTREQLYQEARRKGIKGASKMTKAQLEDLLGR